MMDSVKDSLQEAPDGTHIAIPGTPKSNQSPEEGAGLGEDLENITGGSSGEASEEEGGSPKPTDSPGKHFAIGSVEEEDVESSDATSGATLIRRKTTEALKRLQKDHLLASCCSICNSDYMFPIAVACQCCGEMPAYHHTSCCKVSSSGNNPSKNRLFEERWQQAESLRQSQEQEKRAQQQRENYEARLLKIVDQKTELMRREQQIIKEENDSLRDMIRSKCAANSELLIDESTAGTPHDMLLDLGLKSAQQSILVHARTLHPHEPEKAAELVAET